MFSPEVLTVINLLPPDTVAQESSGPGDSSFPQPAALKYLYSNVIG